MNIQQEIKQLDEASSKIVDCLSKVDINNIEDRITFTEKGLPIVIATKEQQILSFVKTMGCTTELLSLLWELKQLNNIE